MIFFLTLRGLQAPEKASMKADFGHPGIDICQKGGMGMEKKEYHGFDVEEEDLSGIEDIITASPAGCATWTFYGYHTIDLYILSSYLNDCYTYELFEETITVNFGGQPVL